MRRLLVLLALCLPLAGAACGEGDGGRGVSPTTAVGNDPAALDGRTFVSDQLTISFVDGELRADPGCNTVSGSYEITDGRLVTPVVSRTEMACLDQALSERDDAFVAFLAAQPTVTLDGDTLTLSSPTTTLVLIDREVAQPDLDLVGTRWTLDTIIDGGGARSVPTGVVASFTVQLDISPPGTVDHPADGDARWGAGCEIAGAEIVSFDEGQILFGEQAIITTDCTPTATPDEDRQVLASMNRVLTGRVTYEIDAGRLTLMNGDQGLGFRSSS